MKIFEDTVQTRGRIVDLIHQYGYCPEHNVDWYEYCCGEKYHNVLFESESGPGGILATVHKSGKDQYAFVGPLAPAERRLEIIREYIADAFEKMDTQKVWLELEAPLRRALLKNMPDGYRANRINYTLTWPVMDLLRFDPMMPGGRSKAMRKERNKFYRNHLVEVHDAKSFGDLSALEKLIDLWIDRRPTNDHVWHMRYRNLVSAHFEGMDEARIFIVDGKPVGFNAGWKIPNSTGFYAGVGIHDYSIEDLGLVLYWEDLAWLKLRGYATADMGGTFGSSLYFKNKFHPDCFYKTFVFSIEKR